jgi:hypothetical protein
VNEAKLISFKVEGNNVPVRYVETMKVKDGVMCDIYSFQEDDKKDLAIVTVSRGSKTPLQRILQGEKTIEGFVRGQGLLTVWSEDGTSRSREFGPDRDDGPVAVRVGQIMQWHANADSDLVFYEICEPPYEDGRFENLPDDAAPIG